MEAPWHLILVRKFTPNKETNNQKIPGSGAAHREGEAETQCRYNTPQQTNPPRVRQGPDFIPRSAKGEGRTDTGIGIIHGHVEQGEEAIGRGLRVAGVGDFQVDGIPRWERRCVAGAIER